MYPQSFVWTAVVYLLDFLLGPSILCRRRSPTSLFFAILLLSPIQPYQLLLATSFFWHVPYFMLILSFRLSRDSTCFVSGCIPSSALSTVLLVVCEHPSAFLVAVICAVSSCFTDFVFHSHTSLAYSSLGTITFIRIHILIVSKCESVRIASILPTCITLSYYLGGILFVSLSEPSDAIGKHVGFICAKMADEGMRGGLVDWR